MSLKHIDVVRGTPLTVMQQCPSTCGTLQRPLEQCCLGYNTNYLRSFLCNPSFGHQVTTLSTDDGRGEHFEQLWAARQEGGRFRADGEL